jgi:hypothetical protein
MPWHGVTERAMAALGRAGADQYLSGFSIHAMQRPESTKVLAVDLWTKHVRFLLRRMSTQEALALLLPAPSNTVVINARCSLRIEANQRVIVAAGLPVYHSVSLSRRGLGRRGLCEGQSAIDCGKPLSARAIGGAAAP